MQSLRIIKNLGNPVNLFVAIGAAVLIFDINYYMMSNLLGTRDLACVVGANLTLKNVIFAGFMSVFAGIMVAGVMELYRKRSSSLAGSSATGLALFFGTMTMFCTACSLPFISVFGLSIGLSFFTTYEIWFQVLSLGIFIFGLHLLNKQLNSEGVVCRIK